MIFGNVNNLAQLCTNFNNMTQLLQNINKVEFIETRYLSNMVLLGNNEVSLQYWRNFIELCLVGLAAVDVSQAVDNGSRLTTIKLTARTTSDFAVDNRRLAWRITTVTGDQYLIGTTEQPFPVTTVANDFPDKATSQSGKKITVSWQTPLNLLKIKA